MDKFDGQKSKGLAYIVKYNINCFIVELYNNCNKKKKNLSRLKNCKWL